LESLKQDGGPFKIWTKFVSRKWPFEYQMVQVLDGHCTSVAQDCHLVALLLWFTKNKTCKKFNFLMSHWMIFSSLPTQVYQRHSLNCCRNLWAQILKTQLIFTPKDFR
jgi:hypothetical protein